MLIDPVPTEDGNVLVDGFGLAHVFRNPVVARATREAASDVELASADQHSVHYATCPARRHAATVDGQEALL
jgi:hypothetical protein